MQGHSIWKFPLTVTDYQTLTMPEGAEILSVQDQDGALCLWALVDPQAPMVERLIEVFGTGHPIPTNMGISRNYLASVQQGRFVWHVFERIN